MTSIYKSSLLTTVATLGLASAATAQEAEFLFGVDISDLTDSSADLFVVDNTALDGFTCIGNDCSDGMDFEPSDPLTDGILMLNDSFTWVDFRDSGDNVTNPGADWRLRINDDTSFTGGGINRFSVQDLEASTIPFTIVQNAPQNAFWMAGTTGDIGLGTAMPQSELHVMSTGSAGVRLEADTTFEMRSDATGFAISDEDNGSTPFRIQPGAAEGAVELTAAGLVMNQSGNPDSDFVYGSQGNPNAFFVDGQTGYVGFGTGTPQALFEVSSDDTFSFFRITANGAPTTKSADVVFTQGPLGTGEFRYNIVDGDGPEMRMNADGDVNIVGTLVTGGPNCASGCDAVFSEDYDLLSIEEHADRMFALGHLPAVGPTVPNAPVNISEQYGRMLNELEHAHIYIASLQADVTELRGQLERQSDALARLDRIEAMLTETQD